MDCFSNKYKLRSNSSSDQLLTGLAASRASPVTWFIGAKWGHTNFYPLDLFNTANFSDGSCWCGCNMLMNHCHSLPPQAPDANTELHHYSLNVHRMTPGDFFYWWAICTGNLSFQKTREKNISSHLSTVLLKGVPVFSLPLQSCAHHCTFTSTDPKETQLAFSIFLTEAKKLSQITNECHLLLETKVPSICKPGPGFSETASLKWDASICTSAPVWLAESLNTVLKPRSVSPYLRKSLAVLLFFLLHVALIYNLHFLWRGAQEM